MRRRRRRRRRTVTKAPTAMTGPRAKGATAALVGAGTEGEAATRDMGPLVPYMVQRAWVGDMRAARIAGSSPARAPITRAAPSPPAQASAGMTVAQPL